MRITKLKALYYFYIVAQQQSIKAAANILFVSQAAVSQQCRLLEAHIEKPLFIRKHRHLELTDVGKRLLPYAEKAFTALSDGLAEISGDPNPNNLTITVLPSFASRWLVPRLGDFTNQYPNLNLMIKAEEKVESFNNNLDLALRYGMGHYADIESRLLMQDYIYPVCHPLYLQQKQLQTKHDLQRCTLLGDAIPEPGFSWPEWAAIEQVKLHPKQLTYDGAHYIVEATLAGQGVALLRHSIVADLISAGSLVRLFNRVEPLRYKYFACAPTHYFQREKIQLFLTWLENAIQTFNNEHKLATTEPPLT